MARQLDKRVKDLLVKHEINPREACWDCHGTWVIYHRYCEIIAIKEGITFDLPNIVEANAEKQIVVLCVTGRIGDFSAWSFGEAAPYNLKGAKGFPYAMAEKRAKDRVILKLAGIHGLVYSEEEADDFKASRPSQLARKVAKEVMVEANDEANTVRLKDMTVSKELAILAQRLLLLGLNKEKMAEIWKAALDSVGAENKHGINTSNIEAFRAYIEGVVDKEEAAWKKASKDAKKKKG